MSWVTDLVFVTPSTEAASRFASIIESAHKWRPDEAQSSGLKGSGAHVFHLGMNYVDLDMLHDVEAAAWPAGTILYYEHECDHEPTVRTWPSAKEPRD